MSTPKTVAELRARLLAHPARNIDWRDGNDLGYLSVLAVSEPDLTDEEINDRLRWRREDRELLARKREERGDIRAA